MTCGVLVKWWRPEADRSGFMREWDRGGWRQQTEATVPRILAGKEKRNGVDAGEVGSRKGIFKR